MTKLTLSARSIKDPATAKTECVVIPVSGDGKLKGIAAQIDKAHGGAIRAALDLGDFAGKRGQSQFLMGSGAAQRVLLVGCARKSKKGSARDDARAC
jgi:leucyl aminopeptidase